MSNTNADGSNSNSNYPNRPRASASKRKSNIDIEGQTSYYGKNQRSHNTSIDNKSGNQVRPTASNQADRVSSHNRKAYPNFKPPFHTQQQQPRSREMNQFRHETKSISLLTNYFQLVGLKTDRVLYEYAVLFDPPIQSHRLKNALVHSCTEIFGENVAYDGRHVYSLNKLTSEVTEHAVKKKNSENEFIKLSIRLTCQVEDSSVEMTRIKNIIFKTACNNYGFHEIGRDRALYDFSAKTLLRNLFIIPGYHGTFSPCEHDCLLRIDISHKAISARTVLSHLQHLLEKSGFNRTLTEADLIGKQIITKYNKLAYTIEGIDWDTKPTDTFERKNGSERISFVQFYRTIYNLNVTELNQPMLSCTQILHTKSQEAANAVKLVPEFCAISGSSLLKPLKNNIMFCREYNAQTNLDPNLRHSLSQKFMGKVKENNRILGSWRMDFDKDAVKVEAKWLKSVDIFFGGDRKCESISWANELRSASFLRSIHLANWLFVYSEKDKNKIRLFEEKLTEVAANMNFQIKSPKRLELSLNQSDQMVDLPLRMIEQAVPTETQLILVMLPKSQDVSMYRAIKRVCCIDLAVPSQVITSRVIDQNNMARTKSIVTKIAAQMNCKLGGQLWGVKFKGKKTMVVGIDSWRESRHHTSSVGAYVASINGKDDEYCFTHWYSQTASNDQAFQKFHAHLNIFTCNALKKFYAVNGYLPTTIVCYRDGVLDEELEIVEREEIAQIKAAFRLCYRSEEEFPRLIFIVLKKRVGARFFERSTNFPNQLKNPPVGSVISSKVVRSPDTEFYLISQASLQGTVNPTHYNVLLNERASTITLANLQSLTFILTHMYYNWPSQIRVPAPCHYAYRLAALVGESLKCSHYKVHSDLQDKLFYI